MPIFTVPLLYRAARVPGASVPHAAYELCLLSLMIQRIQSVYLLLGAVALLALLFFDRIWQNEAVAELAWYAPVLLILGAVAVGLAVAAVFMYKDRRRQVKLVMGAQWATLLFLAAMIGGFLLVGATGLLAESAADFGGLIALLLPILAYIFFFLARKGIERDIELVRSMDRLR